VFSSPRFSNIQWNGDINSLAGVKQRESEKQRAKAKKMANADDDVVLESHREQTGEQSS
jgi:hypothetical protein